MVDVLINKLEMFGYPVYRQGSLTETAYPDSFFTFWNVDSPDHAHYDNQVYGTVWSFMVNFYSTNPALIHTVLESARVLLKGDGWIIPSRGYDVPSDEPTHTGRGYVAYYLDVSENENTNNEQEANSNG